MCIGFAGQAVAQSATDNFTIPAAGLPSTPTSFDDTTKVLKAIDDSLLNKTQCGGWDTTLSVGAGLGAPGFISKVTGAPGREGEPLENSDSGMAKRKEGTGAFIFPATAKGFVTACKDATKSITVHFYRNGDPPGTRNDSEQNHLYPFILDPHACLWRTGKMENPPLTKDMCEVSCSTEFQNNAIYTFKDCKPEDVKKNDAGQWYCTEGADRKDWSNRAVCSDDFVDTGNTNCKVCTGASCRCPGPGCELSKAQTPYRSFFRKFDVTTDRQVLPEVPKDELSHLTAQVQCYGFYKEIDAKTTMTEPRKDDRCVIGNIKTRTGDFDPDKLRKETQKGKGAYRPDIPLPDPLPPARAYDPAKDIWFTQVMSAFSFLAPKTDLVTGLLSPEKASVLAIVQRTITNPWALYSIHRAIDDTASNGRSGFRPFSAWWQKFEGDAQRVFTPPTVRLRLPASWSTSTSGLSSVLADDANTVRDSRTEPIEVQLQAKDDMPGIVADYLKHALMLDLREEPVPIVVPMGSPIEFRADAQRWTEWSERRKASNRPVPAEVTALIAKLEAYAVQIEGVRAIRAQLPSMIATLLTRQQNFLVGINEWAAKNQAALEVYVKNAQERMALKTQWQNITKAYQQFADVTNEPWCRNDRFTTPIYSLLDPWMPGRPDLYGGVPTCIAPPEDPNPPPFPKERAGSLPILCVPPSEADLVYDLSQLKISTGSIVLPVLKPTQVKLSIPLPGPIDQDIIDIQRLSLPDLPSLPDITRDALSTIPGVTQLSAPTILPLRETASGAVLKSALDRTQKVIDGMNTAYKDFWKSLVYIDPDTKQPPRCNDKTMGPLDCCGWNDARCKHVESDLVERFTRITARPGVLLKEDLQNIGLGQVRLPVHSGTKLRSTQVSATCDPTDLTCQPLTRTLEVPADGWQVIFPQSTQNLLLDAIRAKVRGFTLTPEGKITGDPQLPLIPTAQQLYPVFDVPHSYDLRTPTGK